MFDHGNMLGPRQLNPFRPGAIEVEGSPISEGPGPTDPLPTDAPPPSLPLPFSPLSTATSPPAMPPATTTSPVITATFPSTTLTIPISASSETGSLSIISQGPIPTESQGPSTPSPSWAFSTPTNATTCQPLVIQWSISNPTSDLLNTHVELIVTNIGLKRDAVNLTLVTDQPLLSSSYTWPAVTVPAGDYAIQGIETDGTGLTAQSSTFSVQTGANITCLPSSGNQEGTQNGLPVSAATKHSNTAAITGGTIGGLLLLTCVATAVFFLLVPRKTSRAKRGRGADRGWGGLSSVDSKTPGSRGVVPGDSYDHLGVARDFLAVGAATPTRADSVSSLDGEKGARESVGHGNALPALSQHSSWSTTNVFETESTGHARRGSVEMAPMPSRPPVPDSPRSSLDFGDPFVPPRADSRRSSRTPRKPVPAYQPTPEELDALAMARSRSDGSSTVSHQASSILASRSPSAFSGHHASSSVSGSAASQHGQILLHGLKSKSSGHFENQPVHYLIPDMPPAPRAD